jgi:hypothetical protein
VADTFDFSGVWHSTKHFFHVFEKKTALDEHDMQVHQTGNRIVAQSIPNDEKSYMILSLTLDGRTLTGTYHEQSSPDGPFKGKGYYGALQLLIDEDGKSIRGKWVGLDTHLNMQTGDWELTRAPQEKK